MNRQTQMLCLWCGPAAIVVFLVGFWLIAGLVPPPSPNDSAREIQQLYQDNTDAIRIGLLLTIIGGTLTAGMVVAISTQLKRIEGQYSPLTYLQLGLGMLGVLLFLFPGFFMETVAFRPNRDPDIMLALNDLAWLPFVGAFTPAVLQNFAIAVAVFQDKEERVYPRWLGYFNLWVAFLFMPAALMFFFKTGPFAWNGVFVFWLPLTIFSVWFAVMFLVTRKAILSQPAEPGAAPAPEPPMHEPERAEAVA